MNYRHIFHAGNFADVVKHLALVVILQHLRQKPKPFVVIDTHAGHGVYDVTGEDALRTGEAAAGIGRLSALSGVAGESALGAYLALAADRPDYPGSPLIAARLLRPQDRLVAIERHPEEEAQLAAVLRPFRRVRTVAGDGYGELVALLPPPERRALILIDPPFEQPDEFARCAGAFRQAYTRFATGHYLIWFPIKSTAEAMRFCGELLDCGAANVLRLDTTLQTVAPEGKLAAAGLVAVNPPYGFEDRMRAELEPVLPRLQAAIRFNRLAGGG
jgi:23S rRNA (adenine2030-N6)-methyltransferase